MRGGRLSRGLLLAAMTAAVGTSSLYPHGASRGFHLHVRPDPAAPGTRLTVEGAAPSTLTTVRLGIVGGPELAESLEPPARRFTLEIELPEEWDSESASLQAEGGTEGGETLRASAVLRVERVTPTPSPSKEDEEPQSAVRSLGAPCAR